MITEAAFKHISLSLDGQITLDQFLKLVQDKQLPLDSLLPDMKSLYQQFGTVSNPRGNQPAGSGPNNNAANSNVSRNAPAEYRGNVYHSTNNYSSNYQGQNFERNYNRRGSFNPNNNGYGNNGNGNGNGGSNGGQGQPQRGSRPTTNGNQRPPFRVGGSPGYKSNPFASK
jgi:hypothetical protein